MAGKRRSGNVPAIKSNTFFFIRVIPAKYWKQVCTAASPCRSGPPAEQGKERHFH